METPGISSGFVQNQVAKPKSLEASAEALNMNFWEMLSTEIIKYQHYPSKKIDAECFPVTVGEVKTTYLGLYIINKIKMTSFAYNLLRLSCIRKDKLYKIFGEIRENDSMHLPEMKLRMNPFIQPQMLLLLFDQNSNARPDENF